MAYNSDVYVEVHKILEEKREKNRYILEKRKTEIAEKIPEYIKFKNELITLLGKFVTEIGNAEFSDNAKKIKAEVKENEIKRKQILKANGYPENYLDDIYDCKKCKDTGYILNKRCECLEKLLIAAATSNSNLSYAFKEQNFDNFDINIFSDNKVDGISPRENMKKILVHVKDFIYKFDLKETKSLLFTGNTGVGKTYLSRCVAKTLIEDGHNVLYLTANKVCELLDDYKFNRASLSDELKNNVKELYNAELLIIDDLGTEFKTSYTLSALYELINSRLTEYKKTIVSTNLTIMELKDVYSERLFSRFLGEFTILEFIGEDLRTKGILESNG